MRKRPDDLNKQERLFWSTGMGTDVWDIFVAASQGDTRTIDQLLDKDPSLIRSHYDYRTVLYFAVRNNQLEAARLLLSRGANPLSSGTNDTLLEMATDRGLEEMRQIFIEAMADKSGTEEGERIAKAIRDRDVSGVKRLVKESPGIVRSSDHGSNQPIHWAVMSRQPDLVEFLLEKGADINAKRLDHARPIQLCNGDYSYRGWRDVPADTPARPGDIYRLLVARGAYIDINMAALTGNIERVRDLLDEDPTLVNKIAEYNSYYGGSGSALSNAASAGHIEIVRLLLERGADPNLPQEHIAPSGKAVHDAVVGNHIDIVRLLLEHGGNANVAVESSADTLSAAIRSGNQEMIDLLCSYGAARSLELLAYSGDTQTAAAVFNANPMLANNSIAFSNAASEGHEPFIRLMLRYQPDLATRIAVGVKSAGPNSPIRTKELTAYLFDKGMNANFSDWLGITPLHRFAQRGDIFNAGLFLEYGANINVIDEEINSTPLGYAAKYNKLEMVKFLLQHGADPNLPIEHKWARPVEWARRRGNSEIVEVLERR